MATWFTVKLVRSSQSIGKPDAGFVNAFSLNDPQGMCLECNSQGRKIGITSNRSDPATYTSIMDDMRKAFAVANKADAGLFSLTQKVPVLTSVVDLAYIQTCE